MNTRRWAKLGSDKQSLRRSLSRYAPLIVWMGFISFASTGEFSAINTSRLVTPLMLWLFPDISVERLALVHLIIRKAAHFSEYAVLGVFAGRAFVTSSHKLLRKFWFKWALLLIVAYALLDEYHQSFVPSRSPSLHDSLIDTAGGLTALMIYAFWIRRQSGNCETLID